MLKALLNNKIVKNGSLSLLGTFLVRAVNLISVPVFSRLMNASDYGRTDVFMTYVNIFLILLGLDFHGAVARGRMEFEGEEDEFISSSLLFTTLTSLSIFIVINCFFGFFERVFGMSRVIVNILLVYSYAMFVIAFRSAEYNFYFEYKKNMCMSLTVALGNFFFSVLLITTVFQEDRFWGRILGASIPTVICAAVVYCLIISRSGVKCNWKHVKFSLKFGLPLIPHNLSHMILGSSDKIMINAIISSTASGVYSLVYTLGLMISVLTEAMNHVWIPWMFREIKKENINGINYASKLYLLGYAAITTAAMAISPEIIKVLSSKEYWDGIDIVVWILFSTFMIFVYTLYVNIEFYYKTTHLISVGTMMAAALNVILNILFLEEYGYKFAAFSTVISYVSLFIFHMIIVNYVLKKRILNNKLVCGVVLGVFIYVYAVQNFSGYLGIRIMLGILSEIIIGIFVSAILVRKKKNFTIDIP